MSAEEVGEPWTAAFWKRFWGKNFLPFHDAEPQAFLVQFYDSRYATKKRIFVPLCGKTLDMKWLEERGHDVVGLELSEVAVQMFFDENNLEYERYNQGKFEVFKAKERNITIFCGDIFDCNKDILGLFDGIWDRGAFTSMYPVGDERERYLDLMRSIARDGSLSYLMVIYEHYVGHKGPPYSINFETLTRIAEDVFDANVLSRAPAIRPRVSKEPIEAVLYGLKIKLA